MYDEVYSGIDLNLDELDDDYVTYYNEITGYETDNVPTPEQCGVNLSDEEYARRLENVRIMEMKENNRWRRYELQKKGKTDLEYAYGKDWKYKPIGKDVIVVGRHNIAQYWHPTNMNLSISSYDNDSIKEIHNPNAQGSVIFDSRTNPGSSMVISRSDYLLSKMRAEERNAINMAKNFLDGSTAIPLDFYMASLDQRNQETEMYKATGVFNQGNAFDQLAAICEKYKQGGINMTQPAFGSNGYEFKLPPGAEEGLRKMGQDPAFLNGMTMEEVREKWDYMAKNHIPIHAANDVIFGGTKLVQNPDGTFSNIKPEKPTVNVNASTAPFNPFVDGAKIAMQGGAQNANNIDVKAIFGDIYGNNKTQTQGTVPLTPGTMVPGSAAPVQGNTQTQQAQAAPTGSDDPLLQMMQRGVNNFKQAQAQAAANPAASADLLTNMMAKMANITAQSAMAAPQPEVHHTVFTAGGQDTRGTLKEQLLTLSDMLLSGLNSNNQDIATAINIVLDLAGLDQKELYAKQNQGIDYQTFSKVMDQLMDRISYVTDGSAPLLSQQIIHYIQNTITNGPNSLIEPLYYYEMLAQLAFDGYISLVDTYYPDLRNSLLQAILYFQKNPVPTVAKDQRHPDGKMNMVPIIFGPNGLLETQMIYVNNSTTPVAPTTTGATQSVYGNVQNQNNNIGGNKNMNTVFDRYDAKQFQFAGGNPYSALYAGYQGLPASLNPMAAGANNFNYIGNGSTVTSTGAPPLNAWQAGIATTMGMNPNGGYGAGYDSVMGPIMSGRTFTATPTVPPITGVQSISAAPVYNYNQYYNQYAQPVTAPQMISARYAQQPVANTAVYGGAPVYQQPQMDMASQMMGMFGMMLNMLSSIENVGGRNVIDVRNLASMFGGGAANGPGVVDRFGKTQPQMNNYSFGTYGNTWGGNNYNTMNAWGNSWSATKPVNTWGSTIPTFNTTTSGNWGSAPTYNSGYNSGLGLTFANPVVSSGLNFTATTPTFNYNPAASVGTGVSNMTFGGTSGTWGAGGNTWGGNSGLFGGTSFVNNTNNTQHSVFGRQPGINRVGGVGAALGY